MASAPRLRPTSRSGGIGRGPRRAASPAESSRYDAPARHFLGGWVLPIRHPDTHGLRGWQVKAIAVLDGDTGTTKGTEKSRTLFGIDAFEPGNSVILVESPLDVAVLRTFGVPALASFGAGVSQAQRQLLADRSSKVILAMDNDRAGRESTDKLIKAPEFSGKELYRFNYEAAPDAKDPGDMSDDEIREALRTAKRIRR